MKLIKICHIHLVEPLKHIINLIFSAGCVPQHFKESIITPVYKNGSRTDKSNYRPISVINNLAKIFEKALKSRLEEFLNINHTISNNQFGFRANYSTNDAIYTLTSSINKNLDENKKCITVFLDLAKAFDTVSHKKLITKLESVGIRGIALEVFASYLKNRLQFVKIEDKISNGHIVTTGVPQGTVIAPILFSIFINNLCQLKITGKLISYADDTAVIFSGSNWDDVVSKVSKDMAKIKNWLDSNLLALNISKTKFITFSIYNSKLPNIKQINIDNNTENLESTDKIKYLGVIVDKNLKWHDHILYITGKIRKLIHKFYNIRDILSRKTLLIVYKSLIESIIRYGIIVWGGTYENALMPVKIIQKTILKIISHKPTIYPSVLLFKEIDTLSVKHLYILEIIVHVKTHLTNYNISTYDYNTKSKENKNLNVKKYSRTQQQNFIDYLGPWYYNLIPIKLKNISNKKQFRKKLLAYIINNPEKMYI